MVLKALEMQGFKSFPDKTVMEFSKGMTAVIGPNGSGKSNISDAVRWVLGEQSTKSLRGAKMEDVVFSGTDVRRALGFAEVTLRLDNSERTMLSCDTDEVSVTRKYYRSGESEYLLNGAVVRLRDIHELFMDTGLGRDGYSLVGQGRVADLVSSRSSQRRDMLEEAAGISQFRYRRTDANRRLDQAEENLVRLRDILLELDGRIGPLKIQSEKAARYLEFAGEKKNIEIGLWIHTIEQSKTLLKEQEHKLSLASLQQEQVNEQLEKLAQQIEQNVEFSRSHTLEIEQVRQSASQLEEQAVAIDAQVSIEENSIAHNQAAIERITKDMMQAASTQDHIDGQIAEAQNEITALESRIRSLHGALNDLAQSAEEIRKESLAFSDQVATFTQTRMEKALALSDLRVAQSTAESSAKEIGTRLADIVASAAEREEIKSSLDAQVRQAADALSALRESITSLTNAISGYRLLAQTRRDKAEKAKTAMERFTIEMQHKAARTKLLEDLEKNMEGYSGSVKAVMRESDRGALRGIHKPLSQLISVKKAYSVAIETALGAAIQNIVTDNEQDAKQAISFLKQSNAGRATFLPLTSIRTASFQEKGVERCPGFVGMANTLVESDAIYQPILSAQLSRTAVMETMDHAIAAARQFSYRFRIVTLDGQVLNVGGSLTGGSQARNAGILSRVNEIGALHRQLREMQKQLADLQAQHKTAEAEAAAAAAELDGNEAALTTTQEDCIRKESEHQLLAGRLETALVAIRDFESEKHALEKRMNGFFAESSALQSQMQAVQEELSQLDAQMEQYADEKHSLTEKLEEIMRQETQFQLQILACQKDIQAKQESISALDRRKNSHSGRIGDLNTEISTIAQQSIAMKQTIAQLLEKAAALRSQGERAKTQVHVLLERRNQTEAEGTLLRTQEREKTSVRESLGGELARLEERRNVTRSAMEDAQSMLFDEYQLTLREAQELEITLEDADKAQRRLNELKSKIRALGNVNVAAVEEYREVLQRYEFLKAQIDDVEHSRMELLRLIQELTAKMAERFGEQFEKINRCFGETFSHLFSGGKAELKLENPQDMLECAIEIKVQPPGKNVQNIDLLSGGEKGLSAIALLFAILKITPSPFCIFDEVEAALDDVNVSRYAQYVRHMCGNTQFILITHRRGTMEEADILYGVTMQEEGVSKLLQLKTAEMAKDLGLT